MRILYLPCSALVLTSVLICTVVALFNAINKHQRTVVAATSSEVAAQKQPRREAAKQDPLPRVSLLDMFQKRPQVGAAANAPAPAAGWSVLADDFVKFDGDGGGASGHAAGADLLDDDEEED